MQHLPPPQWEAWVKFRKTERSNKVVKEDLRKACLEFDAAFLKGKAWMNSPAWVTVSNQFRGMARAVSKLQVRLQSLYCIAFLFCYSWMCAGVSQSLTKVL